MLSNSPWWALSLLGVGDTPLRGSTQRTGCAAPRRRDDVRRGQDPRGHGAVPGVFARRGPKVAPFKAQNMSNNSMVCADGAEIGRAHGLQVSRRRGRTGGRDQPRAAQTGRRPTQSCRRAGPTGGRARSRNSPRRARTSPTPRTLAYRDLSSRFDLVRPRRRWEAPPRSNLRAGDYVNMGLARHDDIPTVLVGDIDRGVCRPGVLRRHRALPVASPPSAHRRFAEQVPWR